MSPLTGFHLVGRARSRDGQARFRAFDPARGISLEPEFAEAEPHEIARATALAEQAWLPYSTQPAARRASFLRAIADGLLAAGDGLLERAALETALPPARLAAERGRTVQQLRLFADLVDEGSWVDARIDRALPERPPLPRPDLRRLLVALGPVAVFGASNFPLAFSVAGGDSASAWAAGCPVVVKAHPAHPGTSEWVADVVHAAAEATEQPEGVFSLLHGATPAVGVALVTRPEIQAVGFTGSLRAGRALFDAAAGRPQPIPVYAEMGSSNPVFLLPDALRARGPALAAALAASVTQGVGQFCTNPGLLVLPDDESGQAFLAALGAALAATPGGTTVHAGIKSAYDARLAELAGLPGVQVLARAEREGPCGLTSARAALLACDAQVYARHATLAEETYGPATLAVLTDSAEQRLATAQRLGGHLTATLHATGADLEREQALLALLQRKVGRLLFAGVPTGVEVAPAMQHGGPYPATTDARATSVGTAAILRFARPLCFQDAPPSALPEELRDANPRGLWRLVDGHLTRDAL